MQEVMPLLDTQRQWLKVLSNGYPDPAVFQRSATVIAFKIPLKSAPNGGIPPAPIGVIVSGGKPVVNEAAPPVIPICDGTGIVFFVPESANGTATRVGNPLVCILNS